MLIGIGIAVAIYLSAGALVVTALVLLRREAWGWGAAGWILLGVVIWPFLSLELKEDLLDAFQSPLGLLRKPARPNADPRLR